MRKYNRNSQISSISSKILLRISNTRDNKLDSRKCELFKDPLIENSSKSKKKIKNIEIIMNTIDLTENYRKEEEDEKNRRRELSYRSRRRIISRMKNENEEQQKQKDEKIQNLKIRKIDIKSSKNMMTKNYFINASKIYLDKSGFFDKKKRKE